MSDRVDAIKFAIEAVIKSNLIAGISAPGEMPELTEATKEARLRQELLRLQESAKPEILRPAAHEERNKQRKEGYDKAQRLINSGGLIYAAGAMVKPGVETGEAAKAITAFGVAASRSHTGKTGGARRLTLSANGTPVVVAANKQLLEDIQDEQQNNKQQNKTEPQPAKFDIREWLEN